MGFCKSPILPQPFQICSYENEIHSELDCSECAHTKHASCVPTIGTDDTMNGEIESATAAKMSADYEEFTRKHRDFLIQRYVLGIHYEHLIIAMGRDRLRHFVESCIKVPWEDVQDFIADLDDTNVQSKVDGKRVQTMVETFEA